MTFGQSPVLSKDLLYPDCKHTDGTGDSALLQDWQLQEANTKAPESERSNEVCQAR